MSSPIDGVVLERPISNARYLAAGEVLLKIGRLDQLQVEVDVLSQDVVRVKEGDRVDLYGPTIGTDPVAGRVSRIFPAGFTKISSLGVEQQRVRVIVDFDSAVLARLRDERKLGVGYRVLARIYTAEATDATFVPRAALFRGAAGDWQVYAIRDGRARLAGVKVGLVNDNQAQILDGLTATDVVILAPETNLVDGAKVSPIMHGAETNSTDAD
jgi:HlyD family secretion protein